MNSPVKLDAIDRALIVATQGGLPLVARPYQAIGEQIEKRAAACIETMRTAMTDAAMSKAAG